MFLFEALVANSNAEISSSFMLFIQTMLRPLKENKHVDSTKKNTEKTEVLQGRRTQKNLLKQAAGDALAVLL